MTTLDYASYAQQLNADYKLQMPLSTRFWLYLIPDILSIICSLFVLYHLLFDRTLRHQLNNHVIIALLFIGLTYELTSVPLMLHYFCFSDTWKLTPSFAHFWTFIDYLCYSTQLIGFAWATIERHILIFHQQWVSTGKKRFFIHYLPFVAQFIYCFTYYFILIIFPSCEELFIASPFNGVPVSCILFNSILLTYDTLCHQILPTLLIIILSTALLLRVLWRKSRMNRSIAWRKQRKMTIQLLSISLLYLLFMGPRTVLQFCLFIGLTSEDVLMIYLHSGFFANYILFLFPFVCCGSIPELDNRLKKFVFCRKTRRTIAPGSLPLRQLTTERKVQNRDVIH